MALKVKNTPINGGLSGIDKQLNRVATHKSGQDFSVFRTFKKATNPNTLSQQLVRNSFKTTSSRWSLITELQRTKWNLAAKVSGFGSGKAMAVALNTILGQAGMPLLDEPKGPLVKMPAIVAAVAATKLIYTIKIADTPNLAVSRILCKTSGIESSGTSKPRTMKLLESKIAISNDVANSHNFLVPFTDKYGVIGSGQKVFVELYYMQLTGIPQSIGKFVVLG